MRERDWPHTYRSLHESHDAGHLVKFDLGHFVGVGVNPPSLCPSPSRQFVIVWLPLTPGLCEP
jgi:hypothetical protein